MLHESSIRTPVIFTQLVKWDTVITHIWLHILRTVGDKAGVRWSLRDVPAQVRGSAARSKEFAAIPHWGSTGTERPREHRAHDIKGTVRLWSGATVHGGCGLWGTKGAAILKIDFPHPSSCPGQVITCEKMKISARNVKSINPSHVLEHRLCYMTSSRASSCCCTRRKESCSQPSSTSHSQSLQQCFTEHEYALRRRQFTIM